MTRYALPACLLAAALSTAAIAAESTHYSYDAHGRLQTTEHRVTGGMGYLDHYRLDRADNRSVVERSGPFQGPTLGWHGTLAAGQALLSADARFRLTLEHDGNLVLYDASGTAFWSTGTGGSGASHLEMQNDGNLVLYTATDQYVWASNTDGQFDSHLVIQDDGNLVIYRADGPYTWTSSTCCR